MDRDYTVLFRSTLRSMSRSLALYMHIPFCRVKCPYCSFVVYTRRAHVREDYLNALVAELDLRIASLTEEETRVARGPDGRFPLGTVYLGGGTPSLLSTETLGGLLDAVRSRFALVNDAEVTVETEPGTTDAETFAALTGHGVNRVTIGVQSFDDVHLATLGRAHSGSDARAAIAACREGGITNLDLDLMFGLPGQTLASWRADLAEAVAHAPEHLSLYNLTLEPGTPFAQRAARGTLSLPEEETQAKMMRAAMSTSAKAGLVHYEISNFARPGFASRHNRSYWTGDAYLGIGVGAHGFLPGGGKHGLGRRWWNVRAPERYADTVRGGQLPEEGAEELGREAALLEALYLGLRQRSGLDLASLPRRFGIRLTPEADAMLEDFALRGLIAREAQTIKLTQESVIIADYAIGELVGLLDTAVGSDTVVS